MNYKKKTYAKFGFQRLLFLWLSIFICWIAPSADAKILSSIDSGSETEQDATGGTRANEQVDGESFFISGMYIAGKGSTLAGNMTSKGFKLRTGQDNNRVVFSVNFPYTLTDVAIEGIANYEAKGDGACISVTKVEVDGVEVSFSGGQFPPKGAGYSESLTLSGIQANETIAIYFDNSNATGTQINMSYSVNWERPNASEPAIKVSPKTLGLIVGESYKASVKIAPKTFSTHWYSDNEQVATVDEEGNVYAESSGKANIIHAWNDDVQIGDTTFLQVTNIGVLTPYIVKEYDFTSMGDITLTISDEQVGYFYMAGYYGFTPVYACTNTGLEDLAIQQPLVDGRSGWSIVEGSGLYMGSGSDKSAAICNLKAGQIVDIIYTGSELFLGTYEGEAKKKFINESTGRAIFQMEEDGMIGFGLTRGCYVKSITIYEKKILSLDNLTYTLPDEDILYDGESHGAKVSGSDEMGTIHIYYENSEGVRTEEEPSQPGSYTISFEFEESDLYYETVFPNVGKFTIYRLNTEEYDILQSAYQGLSGSEWKNKWDFSMGIKGAKNLYGVTFKEGHVVSIVLDNNNLAGTFPFGLLDLPYIESINVSYNNLNGDAGQGLRSYTKEHPDAGKSLKSLKINSNQIEGNIGLMASLLPSLTDLDAAGNRFSEVSPMINKAVNVDLGAQVLDCEIDLSLKDMTAASLSNQLPPIVLYNHNKQTFGPDIRLHVYSSGYYYHMYMYLTGLECSESNGNISFSGGSIGIDGTGDFRGKSSDLLSVDNDGCYDVPWGCTLTARLSFEQGDGNFDGQVNILDVQSMIRYIMENLGYQPYNFTASNLWQDEQINLQDIICLVNLLLEMDSELSSARRKAPSQQTESDASIYVQNGLVMLNTSKPVAAIDLYIKGVDSFNGEYNLVNAGMSFVTRKKADGVHIIAYALNGSYIPVGSSVVGSIGKESAVISFAMLSDPEANAISVTNNRNTTGIETVSSSIQDNRAIYDLQGRKVNVTPHKGLYIKNRQKIVR